MVKPVLKTNTFNTQKMTERVEESFQEGNRRWRADRHMSYGQIVL